MSAQRYAGASGIQAMSLRLTRARLRTRQGDGWLTTLAVIAFAAATATAALVAGGTWMFYNRYLSPRGTMAAALAQQPDTVILLLAYVGLALLACALLVAPVAGLASSAAVLGARSRETRLATLRLVGLSSAEVSRMTTLETVVQASLGAVLGLAASFVALPLFAAITFQAEPVSPSEMVLPWWGYVAVVAAVVAISVLASWWGLHRVRISPLGVARRSLPSALRAWRLVGLGVGLIAVVVFGGQVRIGGSSLMPYLAFAAMLVILLGLANLALPYVLQTLARPMAHLPWPSVSWAGRRIVVAPRAAWKRVAAPAMVCFIAGYISMVPFVANKQSTAETQTVADSFVADVTTGVVLVVVFSFLLAAVSSLLGQASASFERAGESRALQRMGAAWGFAVRAAWWEALAPLVLTSVACAGLGALAAYPMSQAVRGLVEAGLDVSSSSSIVVWTIGVGIALVVASLIANLPVQRSIVDA